MENEEKFLEIVGTASERAGVFAGKIAAIGSKIAGLASGGVSAGKEMLGLADDTKGETRTVDSSKAKLESELAATQRELKKMRDEAKKTQSHFELKIKDMHAEKESLLSELATARKEIMAITTRENTLTEQVVALESKFAELQRELAETQSQAEKAHSELASQLKDSQVEKDSLISDLEKAGNQANEMTSREEQVNRQAAKLESELATARQELADIQSQAEYAQIQLNKQLRDLQAENESLLFKLANTRKEADDERIRADSTDAQIASLESGVSAFGLGAGKTYEEESDIDMVRGRTESSNEDQAEVAAVPTEMKSESSIESGAAKPDEQINAGIEEQSSTPLVAKDRISMLAEAGLPQAECQEELAVVVPTVEEIKPSIEVIAHEESIGANVENVEEPKPETVLESEAKVDTEAIEPKPMPGVEVTELLEVTAEDVQAADFKNGADKILFAKAFSDFTSREAAVRADAARVIAGIHHELSLRLLITYMADEPSALVRQEYIKALATLEMKEGISAVERALVDEAASVRLAAVWGLYRLAGTESIPALTPMLSDNDEGVRRRAITCIGWVGGQIANAGNHPCQKVISALIQCLNDPAESIKNAALDALQAVTGKKICEAVPEGQISHQFLIDQWRSWWKEELICS